MDIFLSEVSNKSSSFTFQSLPERIKTKFGTKYQNYDIISKGTVWKWNQLAKNLFRQLFYD